MDPGRYTTSGEPPEVTMLDARIAHAGGTSSRIELQPHRLQESKNRSKKSSAIEREELLRENGYLRQEIVFYQESRNAMLSFHAQTLKAYQDLQGALKELSEKQAIAEGRLEKYWGITLNGTGKQDLTRI